MAIFSSRAVQALPDQPKNPPSTIKIKGYFTVDNCFQVWTGTNNAVTKKYGEVKNAKGPDVKKGYSVKVDYTPGEYLYIIAWSDNRVNQGLIGQFSVVGSSGKLYTDDPEWRVYPTGMDFDENQAPTDTDINAFLNADPVGSSAGPSKWQKPTLGPENTGAEPFKWVVPKIKSKARWVWHDGGKDKRLTPGSNPVVGKYPKKPFIPFTSPTSGADFEKNLNDEFLIFAIPLDAILITKSPPPPDLFAEDPFDDNKFALTAADQSALWSSGDAETDLDFLVAWMVEQADEMKFDAHLVGMGVGVRVKSGPKTSVEEDVVVSATDQEDNSTPNTSAPGNAGIRYADGRVHVFPGPEVIFVVKGFVSPLRATLKEEFTGANQAISLTELQTYDGSLPKDSAGRKRYNPLLSALRAVGLFEAMVDRVVNHIDELFPSPDAATAKDISTLKTSLENVKLNAVGKINISNTYWDIEVTYPSYRKIKDNQPFP